MAKVTRSLQDCVETLRKGNLVAIPTETVYGLAGDVFNDIAIEYIFVMKKRPFFDPLIVHVNSIEQAKSIVSSWPQSADVLTKAFWPGPLTLVLPKASNVSDLITSGLPTVGIRMPNHPVTLELIEKFGRPLAAPSANQFKRTSPTRTEHVLEEFVDSDLLVLEGGPCQVGLESTVIGLSETDGKVEVEIYRPGVVTESDIRKALSGFPTVSIVHKPNAAAPGQLQHHYMPKIPLVIFRDQKQAEDPLILKKLPYQTPADLNLNANAAIAARELYSNLRKCAQSGAQYIRVFRSSGQVSPLWDAIWDRLTRAATFNFAKSN